MEILLEIEIEKQENGEYLATSKQLPDLIALGRTISESLEIASDVARKLYESYIERGISLPEVFQNAINQGNASVAVSLPD